MQEANFEAAMAAPQCQVAINLDRSVQWVPVQMSADTSWTFKVPNRGNANG